MELEIRAMSDQPDGFPTPIAAKITGVSVDTLDSWERRGFLKASIRPAGGHGVARVYSFRDLIAVRVAHELRSTGIPPQALRKVVAYLCARRGLSPTDALASTNLVTDGRDVYEVNGDVTLSTLRRPGQRMLLMLPLDEFVAELQANARALRAA
jgi:DNA-binding transcriptional MerR regulator